MEFCPSFAITGTATAISHCSDAFDAHFLSQWSSSISNAHERMRRLIFISRLCDALSFK